MFNGHARSTGNTRDMMQYVNKLNFNSLLSIFIPLMFVYFLILFVRVSKAVMNKYAGSWPPCLIPHWSLMPKPEVPVFKKAEAMLIYIAFTKLVKVFP